MNATAKRIKEERKAKGLNRRRLRKPPRMKEPRQLERRYERLLLSLIKKQRAAGLELLGAKLPKIVEQAQADAAIRADDSIILDAEKAEVKALIKALTHTIEKQTTAFKPEAKTLSIWNAVNKHNKREWLRVSKAVLGVDIFTEEPWLAKAAETFIGDNVDLITSLGEQSTGQIEDLIYEGMRKGQRHEVLMKQVAERYDVSASRARLIARDQVNKLNGNLAKKRQEDTGIKHYIWRTSQDERVRPSHQELEGERFAWDKPPSEGHPGEPIQCRCTAEPDFKEIFA